MMLTISVATQDGRFVTLYLETDWKISKLKEMIRDHLNLPVENQQLMLDGNAINDDELTMEAAGVKNGDVLYALYKARNINAGASGLSSMTDSENTLRQRAQSLVESMPPGSAELEALRETSPALFDAISSRDVDGIVVLLRQMNVERAQKIRERNMRILQAQRNPLDPESQRIIQEAIADQRINENLVNAQNYLPESFGNIIMLYITVNINRVPTQALVDTGAQTTVMSKECAERCNLLNMLDKRFQGVAVGVSTGKIVGKIHLANMKIGSTYVPFSVVIVDNIHIDFILGLDLLRRHQCNINLKDNTLLIAGETVQFLAEREIQKPIRLGGQQTSEPQQTTPAPQPPQPVPSDTPSQSRNSGATVSNEVKLLSETLGISHEEAQTLLSSTNGDVELAASLHYQQQYD